MPTTQTTVRPAPDAQALTDGAIVAHYLGDLKRTLDLLPRDQVQGAIDLFRDAYTRDAQVFIFGNGGSAATASHLACDINKGVGFKLDKKFKVICLNDNIPTMLAMANDVDYASVFVNQLKNFLRPGDLVVGISGSGNSPNVVHALDYANQRGATTLAWVGFDGGKAKAVARHHVHVPIHDMQIAEDLHMILVHMLMKVFTRTIG